MTGGEIKMEHCSTEEQVADLFTKSLPLEVLQIFALRESMLRVMHKSVCWVVF